MLRWIAYVKSLNSELKEEEIPEDYFASDRIFLVCAMREFWEREYEEETLRIRKMLQHNNNITGNGKNTRQRERNTRKEGVQETKRTTGIGSPNRRPKKADYIVNSRILLG